MVKLADLRDGDVFMIDNLNDVPYGAKVHHVVPLAEDEVAVIDRNGYELLSGSPDRLVRVDRISKR